MNIHDIFYRFPKEFPLPFVLDGATGTALMSAGMPSGACPEEWIPKHPETIKTIQRGYYAAGSDAVLAPTFGGNRPSLERHGLCDCEERNAALAMLSRGLECGFVGGDMSPTGHFLRPYGDASFDEIAAAYAEQAKALERYVDFFMPETNISLAEARAAVVGIKSVSDKPVFVTLTVDKNGRTMSGDDMLCALLTLAELGVCAFGANCSVGPGDMLKTLAPLVPYAVGLGVALIAKPNAGMPHDTPAGRVFDLDAEGFGEFAPQFLEAGIYVLGGCCGTDDRYIAKIRAAVDNYAPPEKLPAADSSCLICNAKQTAEIDPENLPDPLAADDGLFDCEDEFALVSVESADDADFLLENMAMLPCPVMLEGNRSCCEKVIHEYCGKIIYRE
jgi:5-methyltetrahydrofolate--homocysteine methyltransferase